MSDAPETMWVFPRKDWFDAGASTHKILISGARDTEYRRADLPATDEQIMSDPRVQALVEAGDVMAKALQGGYIVPKSANNWGKALEAMNENPDE